MIVSAIPFVGNKRLLWDQIEPHFPEGKVFIDMFTGGGTVALNVSKKYETVIACDVITPLISLHKAFRDDKGLIDTVTRISNYFPKTKEGYLQLRDVYNLEPSPAKLQALLLRSNNNMMRFNKSGLFNMTWGDRFSYNKQRMEKHQEACQRVDFVCGGWEKALGSIGLMSDDPREYYSEEELKGVVIYSDCPYSGTTATYNEQGAWSDEDDVKLLNKLLELQQLGCKVVASNVFENKGKMNHRWIDFCKQNQDKFTVYHLDRCYNNSSFRKGTGKTDEVLIVSV